MRIKGNFAGPTSIRDKVRTAIKNMKNGKATGRCKFAVEHLEAVEKFGILKIANIKSEINDIVHFPKDMLKSIFIAS